MKLFRSVLLIALLSLSLQAQNRTRFGGRYDARDFAYGRVTGADALTIAPGVSTVAGSATIILNTGWTSLADGRVLFPISTNAPISVGNGASQESVTPSAVSSGCGVFGITLQCSVTATFANAHASGENVATGSMGLQEAINAASADGAGIAEVTGRWALAGGTTAMITAAVMTGTVNPVVTIEDTRKFPVTYWAPRPTTLSLIGAGAAVTLTGSAGGNLTNSGTYYVTYEYVDPLGGISLPATDSAQITLSSQNTITTSAVAASTGAVGFIPMITASAGATGSEIEVPVTSAVCTLATTLVMTGKPVCAIGATATITANPSSTAKEVSEGTAHTTFAPQPFKTFPQPFQTQYGPFVVGATLNSSNADLAQFYTPAGYFNFLGSSYDVCVKGATATQVASSVLVVKLNVAKQYLQSPVTVSTITFPTKTTAAAATFGGCWKVTTAATGATGTFWSVSPQPWYDALNSAPGTTPAQSIDVTTAASSAVDLTAGLYWSVNVSESAGNNITGPIINSLSITPSMSN